MSKQKLVNVNVFYSCELLDEKIVITLIYPNY